MRLCVSALINSGAMSNLCTKAPSFWNDLYRGSIVQARVISALMLREIHTINGNSKLGYLWVLIQSVFSIAVFWGVRHFIGAGQAPHGMGMAMFMALGFGVWNIFSNTINRCMTAVSGNKGLLTFPQVTELDVMIARTLVTTATQILVTALIICAGTLILCEPFMIGNMPLLLILIVTVPLMSLGFGLVLSSLAVFVPALDKVVPMVLRILFFVSGVFFSVSIFSQSISRYLLWNPVMHAVELSREAMHASYVVPGVSLAYLCLCTLTLCALGGFLERYVRSRRKD